MTVFTRGARRLGAGVLASTVAVALAACGGGASGDGTPQGDAGPEGDAAWTKIIDEAKKEGEVTFYSGQAVENLDGMAKSFEQRYGIKVNIVRDNDANLQTKLAAEEKTGKNTADIVASASAPWVEEKKAAAYYTPVQGPMFKDSRYNAAQYLQNDSVYVSTYAILTYAWNTDLLSSGLSGYQDLLKPELANGKIGVIPPVSGAIVDFYDYLEEVGGPGFVDKLAAQKPRKYLGAQAIGQALASGEISAAAYAIPQDAAKKEGAPTDSGLPKPVFGAAFYTGIAKTAPHPNAAQLLANYMVTPEGQESLAAQAGSVLTDTASAAVTADDVWHPKKQVTAAELEAFRAEFEKKFGK